MEREKKTKERTIDDKILRNTMQNNRNNNL